ncbi:F-box/WD repeat-containing protein 4 [Pseudomyrmex gracilis]|uniref:F-box/WD repeat-containing protein 4 n=1 Tax=Pseudomyrmex gracilis TaxID=219809 RepID=UPI000994F72A|nr:F-box/WD repeat-containing protein 4 [Pseudomyrmex gracilis]
MNTLRLDMLPTEILVIIFDYCDVCDFTQLDQVCKRFHQIIRSNVVWKQHYKRFLVTNQVSEQFRQRCNLLLPSYSKYFISQNWIRGGYQQRILRGQRDKLMPWLQLTSNKLWWSGGNMIFGFDRQKKTHQKTTFSFDKTYPGNYDHDIWRFILWGDYIVTGHNNGRIMWQTKSPFKNRYNGCNECIKKKELILYNNSISALETTSNIIFSAAGSEYTIIRVENSLDIDSINNDNIVRKEIPGCRIRSLAIHPLGKILSVVSEELDRILHIDLEHDVEREEIGPSQNTEIMDTLWEDTNTLLTCGFRQIQKWDLRVRDFVSTWHDPTDAGTYCISSDHHNTMITGAQYHSKAVLWDQRMPTFVQMYFMQAPFAKQFDMNSPIYSLRFDSTWLYCATDRFLYELDFSKHGCPVRDYKSIPLWNQTRVIHYSAIL